MSVAALSPGRSNLHRFLSGYGQEIVVALSIVAVSYTHLTLPTTSRV